MPGEISTPSPYDFMACIGTNSKTLEPDRPQYDNRTVWKCAFIPARRDLEKYIFFFLEIVKVKVQVQVNFAVQQATKF
jgi:hypothetical protein